MCGVDVVFIVWNNEELGCVIIDVNGFVLFLDGLLWGKGGVELVVVMVYCGVDFNYMDLCWFVFDLMDCGVGGCLVFGLIDVYLYIDRGIYCFGE